MRIAFVVLAAATAACTGGPPAGGPLLDAGDLPRLMSRPADLPGALAIVAGSEKPITPSDLIDQEGTQVPPGFAVPTDPSDEAWAAFRRDLRERAAEKVRRYRFKAGLVSAVSSPGHEPFGKGAGVWVVTRAHLYESAGGARDAFADERAWLDASNQLRDGRPAEDPRGREMRPPAGDESFGMLRPRDAAGVFAATMTWRTGNAIIKVAVRDSSGTLTENDVRHLVRRIDARARGAGAGERREAVVVRRPGRG